MFSSGPFGIEREHPTPWSIRPCNDRHGGNEFVVVDARGRYVAEASERYIAELIASGKSVVPQPEESTADRVRRLAAELEEAKKAMQAENKATFGRIDQKLKTCIEGSTTEHNFRLSGYEINTSAHNTIKRSGEYRCSCGAKMSIEN